MVVHEITTTWYLWLSLLLLLPNYQTALLSLTRVPSAFEDSGGFSCFTLPWRRPLSSLSHAPTRPSSLPPSSSRAAANIPALALEAREASVCHSVAGLAATLHAGPVVRAHMTCWAQEPHVASSISCKRTPASACPTPAAAHHLHRNGLRALFLL